MAKKIFFGNYKGGVGKTTTVFEIGVHLATEYQQKVLLIDLDPQCSLSKICQDCRNEELSELEVDHTLNYVLELYAEYIKKASRLDILEKNIDTKFEMVEDAIQPIPKHSGYGEGRLDFVPTVLDMKNSRINDIADRFSKDTKNILVISRFLDDIQEKLDYDFILIDCPPTSNLIIQSVFLACDYYLIPTVGDEISTNGVADYITEIESVYLKYAYDSQIGGVILKYYFGEKPELIGILETMYKSRPGEKNMSILKMLDDAISAVKRESLITETKYAYPGYRHIFNLSIRHLDNRSDSARYGVPLTVSMGDMHEEYSEITRYIFEILSPSKKG